MAMVIDASLSKTPRSYGKVVKVSQLPRHIGTTHSFHTQHGLLTLEIQQSNLCIITNPTGYGSWSEMRACYCSVSFLKNDHSDSHA